MYQIVRKISDEHSQYGDTKLRLSFAQVYDEIKRSNSSLNRKNKKLLEDSIERVLETLEQDARNSDSDPIDGEYDGLEKQTRASEKSASNGLNRSIVGAWATSTPKGSSTPKRDQEQEDVEVHQPAQPVGRRRQGNGEPLAKKRKVAPSAIDRSPPTNITFADLGGVDEVIQDFEDLVLLPMTQPEVYVSSRIKPPRGILIHGPPGCGKTMIVNALAAELEANFIPISAPSIVSGMSGESEKALREHFEEAKKAAPCLVFIDEIDAITPKRENAQREMEKRIVAQLLTCMDDLALEKTNGKPVIVLAATNRPDSLDPALRRGGRFDKEINMSVPSEPVREQILRALTRQLNLSDEVDLTLLAKRTPGFVGADLDDLVSTAAAAALKRYRLILKSKSESTTMDLDDPSSLDNSAVSSSSAHRASVSAVVASFRRLYRYSKEISSSNLSDAPPVLISNGDFLTALPRIQPSALREGFATIPSTTFADIGALSHHRSKLFSYIINPILKPWLYKSLGISPPSGVLLWGPPGCGKTLLAKAVANESKANFISVKGPELLNKYVGESERAVRQVFTRARSSVPVVIFFDELDALVPRRDGTMSDASARVVNTLLTELDGVGAATRGIYVMAATNRPDIIDPAMLRPGRLGKLLFVGLPAPEERVDILKTLTRKMPGFVFTDEIADIARSSSCDGFSGADLASLLHEAGEAAVARNTTAGIEGRDFEVAKAEVGRSVDVDVVHEHERLQMRWGKGKI